MTTTTTSSVKKEAAAAAAAAALMKEKHESFISNLEKNSEDELEYWVTEHLRVSGVYWGLTALSMLRPLKPEEKQRTLDWVMKCIDPRTGGFGGNIGHDAHLLYTTSAVQLLVLLKDPAADREVLMRSKEEQDTLVNWIAGLQQADGSFAGDEWGEIDTRFTYCAVACLALLGRLHGKDGAPAVIDTDKAAQYIMRCQNFDGGFGSNPGAESHAGQVFTCVGALFILGRGDLIDRDRLAWWLAERQVLVPSSSMSAGAVFDECRGGLNGRPEKLADVCYSWWVLSSLSLLGRLDWIDQDLLAEFILRAQDQETGGIADRPGDVVDVYHTFFGIAGLSLMGRFDLLHIDPAFALPTSVLPPGLAPKPLQ